MEVELHQLDLRYEALRSQQPAVEKRLLTSIHEHGQQVPVVVCVEDSRYVVVDGYKRIRVLKRLHSDVVQALEWPLPPDGGLIVSRLMCNSASDSALEQGWCLQHLKNEGGLSDVELARRFDRTVSWVHRRIALVKSLPDEIVARIRQGSIGAFVAQKYLVPLARANLQHACQLAKWISEARPSTRQVGLVYSTWQKSSAPARAWIVANPGLVEKARTEEERPASVHEAALKDIALVSAVTRRVQKRVREVVWLPDQQRVLIARVDDAKAEMESLCARAREVTVDAG